MADFTQDCAHSPGCKEVFHITVAYWFQIDQYRGFIRNLVQTRVRNSNAQPPGHRGQMHDRIRRATDGHQNPKGVFDRFLRNDLAGQARISDQIDCCFTAELSRDQPIRMHCWDCRTSRQRHTERLCNAGHCAGRTHDRTSAGSCRQTPFNNVDFFALDLARAVFAPKLAAICAGTQPLTPVATCHHRACNQLHSWDVGRCGTHQLSGHRFVTATDEHNSIHRLRAHHFLGVHGHQVTIDHAGGVQENLTKGCCGKGSWQCARRQNTPRNCFDKLGHCAMAVVET